MVKTATKNTPGQKLKTIIKKSEQPTDNVQPVKRKPMEKTWKYDKYPVIRFDRSAKLWAKDAIWMKGDEFNSLMRPRLRQLHREIIGWIHYEHEDTLEKASDPINVYIYGSNGILTDTRQETVYQFYVWYENDRYLWTAYDLAQAFRIIESIRQGEIINQQREKAEDKRWKEKQRQKKLLAKSKPKK